MTKLRQMQREKVVVNGYNFYIRPFPAMVSAGLAGDLASMLTPVLSGILPLISKKEDGEEDEIDIDIDKAATSLASCMDGFSGKKVESMLKKMLIAHENIAVEVPVYDEDGVETGELEQEVLTMDLANELFCGEVQGMFVLSFHVIKLNFNGFFKKLGGQYGKVGEALVKKSRKIL